LNERLVDIQTASGAIDTFVVHPSDDRRCPPVVIYMDVWGLREELFDIARRIATVGYYCVVPNFYYRQGKIRNECRNEKNQMITLERLDEPRRAQVLAPLSHLTDSMVVEDTGKILSFIDADRCARPNSAIGCIGYCMGGRHVFRVTARYPDRFKASVSLHGTELVSDSVDSPHLDVLTATGEIYCGFGEKDRHTPRSAIATLDRVLQSRGVRYRYEVHRGADHGYALPDRDVYDKHCANRDWELIVALFHRQLRPYST
jgi:carboxymethylenebutenolidase